MNEQTIFRVIIIDENPANHQDFIKILQTDISSEEESLEAALLGEKKVTPYLPRFEIDIASQGLEGIDRIKQALEEKRTYSLAFVDIRMPPGWDGIDTIKHIWKLDKDIQVVIYTAYSDSSWEETAEHLGKTDNLFILKKPFDTVSVRQLACALTTKWRLAEDARKRVEILKKQVQELQYQAAHDALTGLFNRFGFFEEIRLAIKNSEVTHAKFAVLFLDVDRFKLVNNSLSHAVGDQLLREVSQRFQAVLRPQDVIARLGGDEFAIIFMNVDNEKHIKKMLANIINTLKTPFNIADRRVTLTISAGISVYPKDGETADLLLRNADTAMYYAKAWKGNNHQFYTDEMNKLSLAELDQEMELHQAIANEEFFLSYQPQIELLSERIVAVEALLRWRHPKKGILPPMDFVPLAEETGLVIPIGVWAIWAACKQNKAWQKAGLPPIRVAVNVSIQQIQQQNFIEMVSNILRETELEPKYLELELTENVILSHSDVIRKVNELKKLGVNIAIDDFGTGYSSLSYLHKIPLDRLKIDSSFIQHIQSANDDEAIIRAVIAMAKHLKLEVLAEGVETIDQLNFLKKNKCGDVQGFYFSTPLSAVELESILKNPGDMDSLKNMLNESK